MTDAYIALGSNLGDRLGSLREAVAQIARLGPVTGASRVYETAPVGYLDQPPFLNAVVRIETDRPAHAVMAELLAIETRLGRTRSFKNAPRTLDLDLLFYGDAVSPDKGLLLPHPRLHERAFVLVPLADIAPELIHPISGSSVAALRDALPDAADVQPLDGGLLD